MPTSILACESCGGRKPFAIPEEAMAEVRNGKAVSGHCPACRAMTHWVFAFLERRGGRDRRAGWERRTDTP